MEVSSELLDIGLKFCGGVHYADVQQWRMAFRQV